MATTSFDPESGRTPSAAGIARNLLYRRSRLIWGLLLFAGLGVYLLDSAPKGFHRHHPPHHGPGDGQGHELSVGLDFADADADGPDDHYYGDEEGRPAAAAAASGDPESQDYFVVDQFGDHFYPNYHGDQPNPPFDPDVSLLPDPVDLFPEVDLRTYLQPAQPRVFPAEKMRSIVSPEEPPSEGETKQKPLDADSFISNWKGPEDWRGVPGEVNRIQWDGFEDGTEWETESQRQERKERAEAVRRGFVYAWQEYKDHAWGHDEVKPVSGEISDPFNNWGASVVDTLDTLLLMGFNDEYNECRPIVNQLKLEWVGGKDWARGYISDPDAPADEETGERPEPYSSPRDQSAGLGVFETGIRYLGGLLGAYDLSGDELLVERAVELAGILKKAFHTRSGLPFGRIDPGSDRWYSASSVSLAEVGSMTLELMRLSRITGDRQWHDLAQRVMDFIEHRVIPRTMYEPLITLWFQPDGLADHVQHGTVALGAMADSYYEYLIKTYKLLGGSDAAQQYRRIYEASIDAAREHLFVDVESVPGRDILAIGKINNNHLAAEIEHLTCFAGGMLGMGSKLLDRPKDLVDADRFTKSCYWISAASPSGVQPEMVEFYEPLAPHEAMYENVSLETGEPHYPFWNKADLETAIETNRIHKDRNDILRWNKGGKAVFPEDGGRAEEGPQAYYAKSTSNMIGTKRVSAYYINRPETIESVWYMFRLTGDRKWQDRGWKMFVSWMQRAKAEHGISSIANAMQSPFPHGNNMESFTFAETFKYHFLLQSDPDLLSLDDYVLNTEAHPFLANPDIKPGSQGFWKPIKNQDIGERSSGTDAQKWVRYEHLRQAQSRTAMRAAHRRPAAQGKGQGMAPEPPTHGKGGGGGMGGGGGNPNIKPQPPSWLLNERDDLVDSGTRKKEGWRAAGSPASPPVPIPGVLGSEE